MERSGQGSARALRAAIYPISSSISEMSAKMRKTTSSVSAASTQLRNCSCMVASRPRGPARTRARSGAGASVRGARQGSHPALLASPGQRWRWQRQRQTGVAQALRARSLPLDSRPPLFSSPLPSPAFSPPRVGLRVQFDSFATRLCSPPPTPVNSTVQPPALASPDRLLSAPEGAGTWPEPATPRLG